MNTHPLVLVAYYRCDRSLAPGLNSGQLLCDQVVNTVAPLEITAGDL